MGKIRAKTKSGGGKDILRGANTRLVNSTAKTLMSQKSVEELVTEAAELLEQSRPELAIPLVDEALRRLEKERNHYSDIDTLLKHAIEGRPTFPQTLLLGAEVNLALGEEDTARSQFVQATTIDPDGALISADPYLWLSQLSEEGGKQSIFYFEKATEVLRNEIEVLEDDGMDAAQNHDILNGKRSRLAEALCGMTEVYMTDLSWEDDAEARCEQYVTEAIATCPERLSAGALQTLASVRISQERLDEARTALANSRAIWKNLPPETNDPAKPDFATRVSLGRLLMEVEMETDASLVLEELLKEDDQSIESLYLAGWCQILLSQKPHISSEDKTKHEEQARLWLGNCLKLYCLQEYEDTKLREHALELVGDLNRTLGTEDDEDEWEDTNDDEDDAEDDDLEVDDAAHDGDVEMT